MNKVEALYYDKGEGGIVTCRLCHHKCKIPDGGAGFCRVRENEGGTLYASGYGICPAVSLDPIEKKPLYRFHPGTKILSVGGYGCNLRCPFCQNYEIAAIGNSGNGNEFISPEKIAAYALMKKSEGNIGLAFTYNEPTIGIEYALDCMKLTRAAGLLNVLVTNGSVSLEALEALLNFTDAMNIDVKGFTPDFYRRLGGDLQTVKETVEISAKRVHVEVTTLIIPGENDSEEEIENLARWLAGLSPEIPLHLTRFFPRYKYNDREATPKEKIRELQHVAERHCKFVYAGNMG